MTSRLRLTLATNLVAVLLTLLGAIVSEKWGLPPGVREPFVWLLLGAGVMALAALYLYEAAGEHAHARNELLAAERRQGLAEALPGFLVMKRREDRFLINIDGSGSLRWRFQVQHVLPRGQRHLSLTVAAERPAALSQTVSVIRVSALEVNGQSFRPDNAYSMLQLRSSVTRSNAPTVEFGVVSVPLDLSTAPHQSDIELQLEFDSTYLNWKEREFIYVDVPYITELLTVTVESKNPHYSVIPVGGEETIEVTAGECGNKDLEETTRQNLLWKAAGPKLEWVTSFPKLGHRYEMRFRMVGP